MNGTDIVAMTDGTETAGAIVYCRVSGAIQLNALGPKWRAAGCDTKLLPAGRTEESALKRALQELPKGFRKLIRPLDKFTGFALVNEQADGDDLDYDVMLRARVVYTPPVVEGDPMTCECKVEPEDHELADAIRAGFQKHLGSLTNNKISSWVWGKLAPTCEALSLRDTGGIYFIPRNHIDAWRKMVGVIKDVSDVMFFEIPAMATDEAVEAILDAVGQEAQTEIDKIAEELARTGDDAIGEKALATREARMRAVRTKVRSYESLLSQVMPSLHSKLDDLDADITAAMLIASSGNGGEFG